VHAVSLLIGATAVAVTSSSITALLSAPEDDLIRALAVIGVLAGGLAAIYLLVDHRTREMKSALTRVVRNENAMLTVMRNGHPIDTGERHRRN
jgi:uncharacterized membrane protein YccC